jgi:dTDP-4-dehydrorhamnose 3,5-epimerase
MEIESLEIPDVKVITCRRFVDNRGYFAEVYNTRVFDGMGLGVKFVQDNFSLSRPRGVVRGLHFQVGENPQAKLVRVIRGAILDVAVDIRRNSPTFGRHVKIKLEEHDFKWIFIPVGFAHGFVTLEADTEVTYKVSGYYSQKDDRGILWSDPALEIAWGVDPGLAVVSDKDKTHPILAHARDLF